MDQELPGGRCCICAGAALFA